MDCPFDKADAALIAAARNALPALIERVQELEQRDRKLVDLLSKYAVHQQPCRDAFMHAVSMRMPLPGCICGYDRDVLPVIEDQRNA